MRNDGRSNLRPCHVERSRDISDFFWADIERFLDFARNDKRKSGSVHEKHADHACDECQRSDRCDTEYDQLRRIAPHLAQTLRMVMPTYRLSTQVKLKAGLFMFEKLAPMDAKTVADDGYRALMSGKTLAISGFKNWLVAESVRFAPRKMVTAISRWVAEPVK